MSRQRQSHKNEGEAVAPQVHEALRVTGWILPQTEADVAAAEQELAGQQSAPLPEALRDPAAVLAGKWDPSARPAETTLQPQAAVDASLARAAREGGRLTAEVEQQMRHDREAAERQMDEDQHGQDAG